MRRLLLATGRSGSGFGVRQGARVQVLRPRQGRLSPRCRGRPEGRGLVRGAESRYCRSRRSGHRCRSSASRLGKNSAPHGVIVGPDGAPWFTDGGQNAIVRVDPATKEVKVWPLPPERMPYTNLNTAAFDGKGRIWFTGQNGIYGRLDPKTGDMKVWDAPKGRGCLRHHRHTQGRHLVRVAGRQLSCQRRSRDRRGDRLRAADQGSGRASRVVGFQGAAVGQRMELRQRQRLRSGRQDLEAMDAAGREAAHLRRVGRSG